MSRWNAALVGCGQIGKMHCEAIVEIEDLEFVAYCDIDLKAAQAFLNAYGGMYCTDDFEKIISDNRIDVVYICTRHDTHVDLCVRAARSGKHIMVEKPLALSMRGCEEVGAAVSAGGVLLMTAFKLRFFEMVEKAKELIPFPNMATMQYVENRQSDDLWINDPVAGGGTVLGAGVHSCDLLRHVLGSDPVSVTADGANFYTANGLIDNMAAIFRFGNGTIGTLLQGDFARPSYTSNFYLQLFAKDQSVTLSDRLCRLVYQRTGSQPEVFVGTETGMLEESRAFVRSLNTGIAPPVGYRDGLFATAMILQAFEAIRSGRGEPVASLISAAR